MDAYRFVCTKCEERYGPCEQSCIGTGFFRVCADCGADLGPERDENGEWRHRGGFVQGDAMLTEAT